VQSFVPPSHPAVAAESLQVLVVDDDELHLRTLTRSLELEQLTVHRAKNAAEALQLLDRRAVDVVVSDIGLGDVTGIDLLREIQNRTPDMAVILVTAAPGVDTAAAAVELGAFRYLQKPVAHDALVRAVFAATERRRDDRTSSSRMAVASSFQKAIGSLWMAYQPIVRSNDASEYACEALLRCSAQGFTSPPDFLDAARVAGETQRLGRTIRAEVAASIARAPEHMTFFVNLQASDLADDILYDESDPLSAHASRVILELTERASLDKIDDLTGRLRRLRALGYRVAIDDLGAGYSSLATFAVVAPDIVKLDMSLIRGIHQDETKRRVVHAMVRLCHELCMRVVAEGVETGDERAVVEDLGCDYLQGYLFGRPERRYAVR
jgi:EAL domain-containing protein (putative c-di-GMP-specific phosphodiesterase class I)